ncbi:MULTISPECIES: Hsp20/alpha crystallin family protein [unclassified Rhizobacter]|uniref:Hsp20/alpha crystallin family protein n=1 Tax=unclassified Rhizobacter TaxID=2640088 RepID=UPI0006F2D1D3|nr:MULTISPECIES: Hsp20/alpha crystallin family protein [unclassified Rhizobacter]KQU80283.1 heat-shock protein [Rhizobacter sp. Root29]KQW13779.1 heat-shock protein [Rhizobacter sp. Root1238]KRB20311.1 heat-shock protein [Rhizobacter sp. Root16D2]
MADHTELTTATSAGANERPVSPAVDIFEDAGGITLLADMPGVSKDRLDVKLDGDTLSVEGRVELDMPSDMRALWAEVSVPRFRRNFTLSRELDTGRIEANLKDGVLTLRVPKQAHAQPRRIEVSAA